MFGTIIKTAAVENARPPATASDRELCGLIPSGSKAKGRSEAIDVAEVIKTDETFFPPLSCKMIELLTAVPNKSMKAIIEFMFSEDPKIKRAAAAPKKLGGSAVK